MSDYRDCAVCGRKGTPISALSLGFGDGDELVMLCARHAGLIRKICRCLGRSPWSMPYVENVGSRTLDAPAGKVARYLLKIYYDERRCWEFFMGRCWPGLKKLTLFPSSGKAGGE